MNKKVCLFLLLAVCLSFFMSMKGYAQHTEKPSYDWNKDVYLIVFKEKQKDLNSLGISKEKIRKNYKNFNIVSAHLTSKEIKKLENNPKVEKIIKNYIHKVINNSSNYNVGEPNTSINSEKDWGYKELNVNEELTGYGTNIAIQDSGIRENSEYTLYGGASCYQSFLPFLNCRTNYEDFLTDYGVGYIDKEGHGTSLAGITSSYRYNENELKGIAPNAHLFALKDCADSKVSEDNGQSFIEKCNLTTTDSILNAIDWAITNDIDVLNMSNTFGQTLNEDGEFVNTIDEEEFEELNNKITEAYKKGVYFVVSAGNNGNSGPVNRFPSKHPLVTTVTNVGKDLKGNLSLSLSSSTGDEVDITAPGTNIYTIGIGNEVTNYEIKYGYVNGTSIAAPFVTGTVALAKEKFPLYTNDDIYALLMLNAKQIDDIDIWNEQTGYGIVQANFSKTLKKTKNKVNLLYDYEGFYVPKSYENEGDLPSNNKKKENIKKESYDSLTIYDSEEGRWFQLPNGNKLPLWVNLGKPLFKTVNNRIVYNTAQYERYFLDGIEDDSYGIMYPDEKVIKRFEQPVTARAIDIKFDDEKQIGKLNVNFYDENRHLIKTKEVTDEGVYTFDDIENVHFIELVNKEESGYIKLREFEILGDYELDVSPAIDTDLNFTSKLDKRTFYEVTTNVAKKEDQNLITKENVKDVNFKVTKAMEWNDSKNGYNWYMVTNDSLGIENKWIKVDESEESSIYKQDLTTKVSGHFIETNNVSYEKDLFDDFINYDYINYTILREDGYLEYEFDSPVSISSIYLENIPKVLDNQIEVTFCGTDGSTNKINLGDNELFKKHINLDKTYESVKKVRIQNKTPSTEIRLQEMGFFN